jgi:hypothetical protein
VDAFEKYMNSAIGITSALQEKFPILNLELEMQMKAILEGTANGMCRVKLKLES